MLLHWCTLQPTGPSSLAAIRFANPIRVQSIRIFPTGAKPFTQNPGIVANTEPDAFYLDVFLNAQPVQHSEPRDRRAANALVPTVIAYAGGQVDFTVDMDPEYATRLMIFKGQFESLTIAIYGNVILESESPPEITESKPLPIIDPLPLSRAIDPSNTPDPTLLAKQLLSLIPDSPPLPLVIRLMLCLKASSEEWEHPEFPYVHPDLEAEVAEFSLDTALQWTAKPVSDDVPLESVERFASRVSDAIGAKSNNQAYQIARILCNLASQHPDMSRVLMQHIDLESIFDSNNMDETTLLRLLDASANADIAQHLNNGWFLGLLSVIQSSPSADKHTQSAARRLDTRIRGWQVFEDAISNTQGDFHESARMLKDIGCEEQSCGIWLAAMITHEDLVTKLAENPVLPLTQSHPPSTLLQSSLISVSHDDFIAFVRAYIGVSSVLAALAWTDSVGNDRCRERALAILRLWQGVDGYREIVNHLLLLRQVPCRLEWIITDSHPPRQSGIIAERILYDLAKDPHSILREDLVESILSLKQPLSHISENDRLSMRKVALVSEDGLSSAIEELTFSSDHPLSLRRLRTLRVSLAIVGRELETEKGEWRILQALWDEELHGLVPRLVDLLHGVADDLKGHYCLGVPPSMNQALVYQLFRTSDETMKLIARLAPVYPITSRSMRALVSAVADVFVCTDAADMLYSQSTPAWVSAQGSRQTCIDLARSLSDPGTFVEPGATGAQVVLRTLLEHGVMSDDHDPAHHLLQVFCLIDDILPFSIPEPEENRNSHWVTDVLPSVLPEIKAFFRLLDTENKVHLVKRLVALDMGVIAIGEWLFVEELKQLHKHLQSLTDHNGNYRLIQEHQISLSLRFLSDLVTSNASTWCITCIATVPDATLHLEKCLMSLFNAHVFSPYLSAIAEVLVLNAAKFDSTFIFAVVLTLMRATRLDDEMYVSHIVDLLTALPEVDSKLELLQLEIGQMFSSFAGAHSLKPETAESILSLLKWLSAKDILKLEFISALSLTHLCDLLHQALLPIQREGLDSLQAKFTTDEGEMLITHATLLPDNLVLSIQDIDDLMHAHNPTPSTPKDNTPDLLDLAAASPPTAILHSPSTTGLTKTYLNNDFRQLRQMPSARQNTNRLPSMHVDDFELNSSPMLLPIQMPDVFPGMHTSNLQ